MKKTGVWSSVAFGMSLVTDFDVAVCVSPVLSHAALPLKTRSCKYEYSLVLDLVSLWVLVAALESFTASSFYHHHILYTVMFVPASFMISSVCRSEFC